ncbi:hypothetical protein EDE15_0192 [Edaphobacter aggregans]|uniref:Uncharacterized protein n=1 Tax=Edaphobacter aggregans TaxID=570835 RepID=A0A428MD02_9BACT|nr:hypothetical protein EDE15_0192 [Edaphobacter aggregans]
MRSRIFWLSLIILIFMLIKLFFKNIGDSRLSNRLQCMKSIPKRSRTWIKPQMPLSKPPSKLPANALKIERAKNQTNKEQKALAKYSIKNIHTLPPFDKEIANKNKASAGQTH